MGGIYCLLWLFISLPLQQYASTDTAGLDVKYRSTSNQFAKIPYGRISFFFSDLEFPDQAGDFDGETVLKNIPWEK